VTNAGPRARIGDLVLYVRYLELQTAYTAATGDARQQAFETLLKYSYRIRKTEMIHSKPIWSYLKEVDNSVKLPEGVTWGTPPAKDSWKQCEPVTEETIRTLISEGICS